MIKMRLSEYTIYTTYYLLTSFDKSCFCKCGWPVPTLVVPSEEDILSKSYLITTRESRQNVKLRGGKSKNSNWHMSNEIEYIKKKRTIPRLNPHETLSTRKYFICLYSCIFNNRSNRFNIFFFKWKGQLYIFFISKRKFCKHT